MNQKHFSKFTAVLALAGASIAALHAQTSQIIVNPNRVFINPNAPLGQQVSVSISGGTSSATVIVQPSQGLLVNNSASAVTLPAPTTFTINVNPNNRPSGAFPGYVDVSPFGSAGIGARVEVIYNTTGGNPTNPTIGNFYASQSALSFSTPTGFQPASQTFTVSSTTGTIPSYFISSNVPWLTTVPQLGTYSNSTFVTANANVSGLTPGTYNGSITLTPSLAGYSTITLPVSLTIGQGQTGTFFTSPTGLTFTYPTGTISPVSQNLSLNSTFGAVSYTAALSANLVNLGVQVVPNAGVAPQNIVVTVSNPQIIPAGTTGTLTITPTSGSGLVPITVPITINGSGTGTGNSSLVVTPNTLTFYTPQGGGTPPVQSFTVASLDGGVQAFTLSPSSTNNFINAQASSLLTPATVTVSVNPFAVPSVGTYIGTIGVTPTSGINAGITTPVQVVFNVGTSGTSAVSADETAVALEARAGSSTVVERGVPLRVTGPQVNFTTNVTTNTGGNWLTVEPASGVAPTVLQIRANPANLSPGTYTGNVALTPANQSTINIGVTLTVSASGDLSITPTSLSFAHQTTSTTGPASQSVQVNSSGSALTWTATPTTQSGGNWLQVNPTTGTTGTSATVSVNTTGLTAGTYSGSVRFSSPGATNREVNLPVTLTVTTPTLPRINSFLNAGSLTASTAVPGMIVTITGNDLGPATAATGSATSGQYPTTLGNVRVLFDGVPAPVFYASTGQINAVVPYEIAGRVSTRVVVERDGVRSTELELQVRETLPSLFTSNMAGTGQVAALNQDSSVNGPTNAEARGNVIVLYGTGMGALTPATTTGRVTASTTPLPAPSLPVRVRIGGQEAQVVYAGAAPGLLSGVFQINAVIPQNAPTGAASVVVQVGDISSQANATISVR